MPAEPQPNVTSRRPGLLARAWRRLRSPSARWSVLSLLVLGFAAGAVAIIGTQVLVEVTGTNAFCGGACHSMQWVAREYQQSVHGTNRVGLAATCHDCHIPKDYPELLWYKAKAGTKDIIGEMRGVISNEEKFKAARRQMAQHVWDEYKENDSRACRNCHQFTDAVLARQNEWHASRIREGKATCIDCHKGVAHTAPGE
jgi:nitrate/TMAO reductase-like tetraheme cytochrome c subunit